MAFINIFPPVANNVVVNNGSTWTTLQLTVATAGTPVQGPNTIILTGGSLVVQSDRGNGIKKLYVANSNTNVSNVSSRVILNAGESIQLAVQSANLVWIDADTNGTIANFTTENP